MDHFIDQASSSSVPIQHNQMINYNENFGQSNGSHSLSCAMDEGDFSSKNEKTKREETNIVIPPNELQIIDAMPLRMVPPFDHKPRRRKGPRSPLIDGRRIGLPEGWMFEQRPRTNANYKGKFDQFYYEPETNKQFRSFKEVEKYLQSKGQRINPINLSTLQENDQEKLETPLVVDLTNDAAGSSNPNPTSSNQQLKKRRKMRAKDKCIKFDFKNQPEEVTWALDNARTDNWVAFIGQEKVSDDTQQIWAKTLREVNNPKDQDHNRK